MLFSKMEEIEAEYFTHDGINDEEWCCMVVLMVENDPKLASMIDLFERRASLIREPFLRNIKPNDLRDANKYSTKQNKISMKITRNPVGALRQIILDQKQADIKKARANLSRRLQEFEISKKVSKDDEEIMPDCGPNCYFVLTRFYDPSFPEDLIHGGIPLTAIFEITDNIDGDILSSQSTIRGRTSQAIAFWNRLTEEMRRPDKREIFLDLLLVPVVPSSAKNFNEIADPKRKGEILYDHLKSTLFNLTKKMRNYIHFLQNMDVIRIPDHDINFAPLLDVYDNNLQTVPLECTTVEVILHSLIEQVSVNIEREEQFSSKNNNIAVKNESTKNQNIVDKTTERVHVNRSKTLFIHHKDQIMKRSYHVDSEALNIKNIHTDMYSRMPYVRMWTLFPKQDEVTNVINQNQCDKLQRCIDIDIEKKRFTNCLHLMFFNRMHSNLLGSEERELGEMRSSMFAPGESNQNHDNNENGKTEFGVKSKREMQLETLKKYLNCDQIMDLLSFDNECEILQCYFSEYLQKETLLQTLHKAYYQFSSIDYAYCNLTDSILVSFQDKKDTKGIFMILREGAVPTVVGFSDFVIYLTQQEESWLECEQQKIVSADYENRRAYLKRLFPAICEDQSANIPCHIPFPKKHLYRSTSDGSPHVTAFSSIGRSFVKAMELTKRYFSFDGPSLTFKKYKWLHEREYMTLVLNSHDHLFTIHNKISIDEKDYASSTDEIKEICFHAESKHGIILSGKKTKAIVNEEFLSSLSPYYMVKNILGDIEIHIYDLMITLPNGLVIELIRNFGMIYIKQKYIVSSENRCVVNKEDYRIFIPDGTVMVFMKSGSVIVMYPNSTITRLKVFRKSYPYKPLEDITSMDPSTDQNIKSTGRSVYRNKSERKSDYRKSMGQSADQNDAESKRDVIFEIIRHEVISWNGSFTRFCEFKTTKERAFDLRAAANNSKGVFTERSDGIKTFVDVDGNLTTQFSDGTLISIEPILDELDFCNPDFVCVHSQKNASFSEEDTNEGENEESFVNYQSSKTMEHRYYMKVKYSYDKWTVFLPFGAKLTYSYDYSFNFAFDEYTSIQSSDYLLKIKSFNKSEKENDTRTIFFLEKNHEHENAVCSIIDSQANGFYITSYGSSRSVNGLDEILKSSRIFLDATSMSLSWKKCVSVLDCRLRNGLDELKTKTYADFVYKSISFANERVSELSSRPNETVVRESLRPKDYLKNFVVNRDLTGVEFIHKSDREGKLKKYSSNSSVPDCHVSKNDSVVLFQKTVSKTWSDLFLVETSRALHNTGIKRNELSGNLSQEVTWLFDLCKKSNGCKGTDLIPMPIVENVYTQKWKVFTIGKMFDNKMDIDSIPRLFEQAIEVYNNINQEILEKYKNNMTTYERKEKDIQESQNVYRHAIEALITETDNKEWGDKMQWPNGDVMTCSKSNDSRTNADYQHS